MKNAVFYTRSRRLHPVIKSLQIKTIRSPAHLEKMSPSLVIVDHDALKEDDDFSPAGYPQHVCLLYGPSGHEGILRRESLEKEYQDLIFSDSGKTEISLVLKRAKEMLLLKQENAKLATRLVQCEHMDTDVGCYNWRFFVQNIPAEIKKAREQKYPLHFIIIDIDYFRQINQSYGYSCADEVMKGVAVLTERLLPEDSFFIRGRDDSFVVVVPHLGQPEITTLAEKIKHKLNRHSFKYRKVSIHISISIGVVGLTENSMKNYRDIINALEYALIFSKRKGGNTITFYSDSLKEKKKTAAAKEDEPDIHSLKRRIHHLSREMNQTLLDMIYGFAKAIEVRDMSTANHVEGVAMIAKKIAQRLKLPAHQVEDVYYAAMLHDLGKIGVNPEIICKKGKLDKKEWEVVKTHPWVATEILREIHVLRGALPAILYHHERWNGKGYPFGLKGEEIPLIARIVAIADVYEALTSDRPYRKAYTQKHALKIIREERGEYFDPFIVDIFLEVIEKKKD